MFGGMGKIRIDPDLYEQAKECANRRGYSSVEEFVTHLIEGEIAKEKSADSDKDVEDRLSGLGYIS